MLKKPLFSNIFIIFITGTVLFGLPIMVRANTVITAVNTSSISAGDDLIITGHDFGDKKGNVYIGDEKYPYYGHAIELWSDSKIILNTDINDQLTAGRIAVQPWLADGSRLDTIFYGSNITISPVINSINPKSVSAGDSLTILGDSFYAYGNSEPQVYIKDKLVEVTYWSNKVIKVKVPIDADSGILKIKFNNDFSIEGEYINITTQFNNTTQLSKQWYLSAINAPLAQNNYQGNDKIIVAVIDDGIYLGHPDLADNIWLNNKEIEGNGRDDDNNGFTDDCWGWNFAYNTHDMTTSGTHGTMVAGIIGAYSKDSQLMRGINKQVSLMSLIVSDEQGNIFAGDINKAIYYAVDNGADVINLSLGSSIYNFSSQFDEAIAYAYEHNVVVVVAAGNGDTEGGIGRNLDTTKISPVCNDGGKNMVLGVGATDKNNVKTSWTNYGACVDIYAPGIDITSTAVPFYTDSGLFYESASGTSFATPLVSGTAALIKAQYPNISNQAIFDRIVVNGTKTKDISLLNVYQAIAQEWSINEAVKKQSDGILADKIINTESSKLSQYVTQEKTLLTVIDQKLSKRLSGQILLQVEDRGEAWYIFPDNNKRYYLGTAQDAYAIMRRLGLGATHQFIHGQTIFPNYVSGKILLDVEANGEAYYINPSDHKAYYMKDGANAYNIMRDFGLGISNLDIRKINIGEI